MKTHEFRVTVKSSRSRNNARAELMLSLRETPFQLKNLPPSYNDAQERAAIKRKVTKMRNGYVNPAFRELLTDVLDFLNTRTKRTAARKGGLGRK